ncbi:MAG: hypothetical protein WCZ27_07400 [Tissierellaceae bacterium]
MSLNILPDDVTQGIGDRCCVGTTGCEWDGTLRRVVTEPVFVQKVYDATLVNLQALSTVNGIRFSPNLPRGARIVGVSDLRCVRFFNPSNMKDPRNLVIDPETVLSGGEFVKDERGKVVEVVGPDGIKNQKIIYANTGECDDIGRGTPVFGTQRICLRGNVYIEIDLVILDSRGRRSTITLTSNVPIAPVNAPLILTNFFELCIPSVYDSAFFPRFAEFCNILCETRLGTNSISRDIRLNPETGEVRIDLIIAICIACEKKIIVPVQLCILSTGFTEISPEVSPICTTFPTLFPRQIDEDSVGDIVDPPSCRPKKPIRDGFRSLETEVYMDEEFSDGYNE